MLVLTGHDGPISSAAFSPDGTRIVTASNDNTARVWDAATGTQVLVLTGHDGPVSSAAFLPDASPRQTAVVWDISTLENGDAFQIACQRLDKRNRELSDVEARYRLSNLPRSAAIMRPCRLMAQLE